MQGDGARGAGATPGLVPGPSGSVTPADCGSRRELADAADHLLDYEKPGIQGESWLVTDENKPKHCVSQRNLVGCAEAEDQAYHLILFNEKKNFSRASPV